MHRHLIAAVVAAFVLVAAAPGASAQDGVLDIPIDTVVRDVEGSITVLSSTDVPAEAVGLTCTGEAVTSNQGSVHPNNDLLVETGGATFVFEDVEDQPGLTIPASGSFVLGETFVVSLRMGPDEVFSGGIRIAVDCTQPEPTTTTTTVETTTTTIETTTTAPEVTTTEAPVEESTTTTSASQVEGGDDELPATGPSQTGLLVLAGLALVGGGAGLLVWGRRWETAG
ncbi:MAG: LPXTG cell wall anchor domain-containing protein [Actinomycetota bacterium]